MIPKSAKPSAMEIRARRVGRFVRRLRVGLPWLTDADVPAAKHWAELEVLGTEVFAKLQTAGIVNAEGEPRRLLDSHRQIRMAQLGIEKELGMTPKARAELRSSRAAIPAEVVNIGEGAVKRVLAIGKVDGETEI